MASAAVKATRASRLSLKGPSPPLWSQARVLEPEGRVGQGVVGTGRPAGSAEKRPGGVAIVMAGEAVFLPGPAGHFAGEERDRFLFGCRAGAGFWLLASWPRRWSPG